MSCFSDESFRSTDQNCLRLQRTLEATLGVPGAAGVGNSGSFAGISVLELPGVWFHHSIFFGGYPYSERRRVVYHEAAHLAFLGDDHAFADQAAAYCARRSDSPSWGFEG